MPVYTRGGDVAVIAFSSMAAARAMASGDMAPGGSAETASSPLLKGTVILVGIGLQDDVTATSLYYCVLFMKFEEYI